MVVLVGPSALPVAAGFGAVVRVVAVFLCHHRAQHTNTAHPVPATGTRFPCARADAVTLSPAAWAALFPRVIVPAPGYRVSLSSIADEIRASDSAYHQWGDLDQNLVALWLGKRNKAEGRKVYETVLYGQTTFLTGYRSSSGDGEGAPYHREGGTAAQLVLVVGSHVVFLRRPPPFLCLLLHPHVDAVFLPFPPSLQCTLMAPSCA